ncbi:MAG: alpha/beta hydrolase [Candidatus Electrothrix sp. GW3-4]|uniref:alpha/beta fold hydrolase n=1 Tax=Candidatus Electrothrix sp. GW3-4 TaxID=3126740 RepID=UPI0030CC4A18
MRIILLPGMDGTGILFRPFVQELRKGLPEEVSVQVLSYPADQVLSYGQLIEDVARRLPAQEEIILLAESFSGPIAYALASRQPRPDPGPDLRGHLSPPAQGPYLAAPPRLMGLLMKIPLPTFLLKRVLFDQATTSETVALFKEAISKVEGPVLTARMREITAFHIKRRALAMPCAYIQAGNDRLIASSHAKEIRAIAPQLTEIEIPGPHFILQARPEKSAQVIGEFLNSLL